MTRHETASRTVALATSRELPEGIEDDQPLVRALREAGADPRYAVWDDEGVDWGAFDAVLVRTCWDYYHRVDAFRAWIDRVEAAGVPLWNPPDVLRWNADKRYLLDLSAKGVPVVPTRWLEPGAACDLAALLDEEGWSEAVVKPAVSAGGFRTFRVPRAEAPARQADLEAILADRPALVQPFLREIVEDGEWSFLFFDGAFSHAILKRPAPGEFRIQPQYGGVSTREAPPTERVEQAARVLEAVPQDLLYARVDGAFLDGVFHLVELEAIEPRLFLTLAPEAATRLARGLARRSFFR